MLRNANAAATAAEISPTSSTTVMSHPFAALLMAWSALA
jgi:hypothetical protein